MINEFNFLMNLFFFFFQSLVEYAESLGYSSTSYCIMTTYPRKPLSDTTKTMTEAGLTHDIVLVIDDIDD
jgi:hypothetical protein